MVRPSRPRRSSATRGRVPAATRPVTSSSPAAPPPAWASLLLGAAFLALNLAWAPRASGGGDSSELTVVLATLGLAHPTGYALYTNLGHLFAVSLHACGAGWPWAANAWSALGGAIALALWHALGARLLAREGLSPWRAAGIALLPVIALGLDPAWTADATTAEVYSWHMAWVAGFCLFACSTLADLSARSGDDRWVRRRTAWGGLLIGLGIAHHAMSLLVALPLGIALLVSARPLRIPRLSPAAVGALVPLLAWSYVYYRSLHPAAAQWESLGPGLRETWNHVTAAGYRHYLGGFAPSAPQREELASFVYPWLGPGLLAALAWPFVRGAEPRVTRWALAAAALAQTTYVFLYRVLDPASYFLPVQALGLVLIPVVLASVRPVRRWGAALAGAAALGLALAAWPWTGAALERRTTIEKADEFLRAMWRAVPIRRGYVIWDDDMCERLVQYQLLDREKPELVVVGPRLLMDAGARALFARRHGVDPLGGGSPPADDMADRPDVIHRFADQVAEGINRGTRDSVIVFEPERPALLLLPKTRPASPGSADPERREPGGGRR